MTLDRLILAAAALFAASPADQARPAYVTDDGRIRIIGYNDMDEMLGAATRRIEAGHADVRFDLQLRSTRSAPAALIAGASLLAPMGTEMSPSDRAAFRAAWGSDPVAFRIAHDSLKPGTLSSPTGILVATDNPLRSIDLRMVRRVFTGAAPLTRWGQLGAKGAWANRPIHPVALAEDTAIGRFALNGPLRAPHFAAGVSAKRQSRDVAAAVAADPQAIGLANLNFAGPRVRALAIIDDRGVSRLPTRAGIASSYYPFDRFLLIYARRESDGKLAPAARLLLDSLLSGAGQAAIAHESRGYIPLNWRERAQEREILKKMQ